MTRDDVAIVSLSDGDNYISVRLTPACIALFEKAFDLNVLDIRGAFVSLRKWERVASPSFSEFLLVVDEMVHIVSWPSVVVVVCVC